MKKQSLTIWTLFIVIMLSAGSVLAQDRKPDMKPMPKDDMKMGEMMKSPHHMLVVTYRHNAMAFTRVLWDMVSDGKIENVDLAKMAYSEVKRAVEKIDDIQKMHMSSMGKMDAAAMEKMKPMMEKMEAEKADLRMHLTAVEKSLYSATPDAHEVSMHVAVLLLKFEKMNKPEMKMDMPPMKMPM